MSDNDCCKNLWKRTTRTAQKSRRKVFFAPHPLAASSVYRSQQTLPIARAPLSTHVFVIDCGSTLLSLLCWIFAHFLSSLWLCSFDYVRQLFIQPRSARSIDWIKLVVTDANFISCLSEFHSAWQLSALLAQGFSPPIFPTSFLQHGEGSQPQAQQWVDDAAVRSWHVGRECERLFWNLLTFRDEKFLECYEKRA